MIDLERSIDEQRTRQGVWGPYKTPTDLARYAELIGRVKPHTLIETGTWNGVAARWFAELVPEVITIDRHNRTAMEYTRHGSVRYLRQDSTEQPFYGDVGTCMVSLDSNHHPDHVLKELSVWARWVTRGSYLVVEDTIVRWIDDYRERFAGGPLDAVEKWLPHHPEFVVDHDIEDRWPTTQHPGGWLLRVA